MVTFEEMQCRTDQGKSVSHREVRIGSAAVRVQRKGDTWYLESDAILNTYPARLTDRLARGASVHPDRWLVARRDASGDWQGISYARMLEHARAIGQALLDRNLSPERPIAILSGNDLEHMMVALGAMWAGIPYAPISPAYSLVSSDYGKLRHVLEVLTPGLIFASDAGPYAAAIDAVVADDIEVVAGMGKCGRRVTLLADWLKTCPTTVDAAQDAVGPETIVKFLFTSGSTSLPKAVPTTHRMLCSNQQMLLDTFPEFSVEPPVLVDWLPWNHTFGGSHNVGIALYNGGTLYIDDGRPVPGKFGETVRNLTEIAPTIYFNVPKGWEALTMELEANPRLREKFFSRVKLYFFAGAGLSQAAWDRLERVTEQHCGERIRIMAGLGMTETSPSCLFTTKPVRAAGYVGLPAPGCEVKLASFEGKLEARFRGPHVMSGYWRMQASPESPFDEEGYYRSGDALKFVDLDQPELGLMFDGRLAEDFKLSSGTFVSVGPLRARVVSTGAPYVQDVVVTGINREGIGLLVFPRFDDCCRLARLPYSASPAEIVDAAEVRAYFTELLATLNRSSTGSASMIAHMRLVETAPSLDRGEITDKGSLNQRAVLASRADLVDAMHDPARKDPTVIHAAGEQN
ncbi:feruloyl-CoA synthase [Burkholderia cenocepacia]|uniref:feruloyl-CoA synthase n=1 Tax=Burkholderia cenocepacia TaxID=95486 RepID=UPI0023B91C03|nr:feruloyl-CoA synthase [Burkholderia cenocepacia]MDF0500591.1 feruloyl-CoA synthase [Burkholderia cenocepacia]